MTTSLLARPGDIPADLTDDLTRRRFVGAGSAALAALLAGCAPDRPDASPPGPAVRTVQDMTGRTVEVPVTPERLATTRAGAAGQVHVVSSEAWARPVLQAQLLVVDQLAELLTAAPLSCAPA